ncbi:hypothetical protein BO82DRAFT_400199 [Aspergillus uvarum CBS 121591]|uniref:Uncharacterized protein n=2 Tax=Aspergillus subgen. Circumdati TaxID=2720871 RepID=A0A319CH77_9EURO|nr:hypothetical protein BO82DRAFT_400199 [Aspergillus uvarum CBS 121591]PYH83800.1 hypothetical protein BO82DRAFT_400199 [Aspergillus uvarum CBS 121591]PYI28472.1 hypothetical protein BP00DRAFT_377368 [Aspergillus indologenus CBS 114.80]
MSFLLLLFFVFFTPLLLLLAWLGLSSCMRNRRVRSYFAASPAGPGIDSYGRHYLRTMVNTGPAMSEQIELDDMMRGSEHEE